MKLRCWLKIHNLTEAEFAVSIRVSQSSVSRYVAGRMPRRNVMSRIVAATGGRVTANDFLMESKPSGDADRAA